MSAVLSAEQMFCAEGMKMPVVQHRRDSMGVRFLFIAVMGVMVAIGCSNRSSLKMGSSSVKPPAVSYSGGNGESFREAVKINGARNQTDGVAAEYYYISKIHGVRGTDWFLVGQTVVREKNKIVDVVEIQLSSASERRIYYFEVSDFLSKRRK